MSRRAPAKPRPLLRRLVKSTMPRKRTIAKSLATALIGASFDIGRLVSDR